MFSVDVKYKPSSDSCDNVAVMQASKENVRAWPCSFCDGLENPRYLAPCSVSAPSAVGPLQGHPACTGRQDGNESVREPGGRRAREEAASDAFVVHEW
jgi:hypothetical protein